MSRTDKRRPRRQIVKWEPDEYMIQLEQIGHEAYRLTVHDGITIKEVNDFLDPNEAQQAYLSAQLQYINLLAEFTLAPLPKKPSEILKLVQEEELV